MSSNVIFYYDGQCPFCNKFAELLELKSHLGDFQIKNGRQHLSELRELFKKGYDLDKGAILIVDNKILHGPSAINYICSQINDPSDKLLEILINIFKSKRRTFLFFPLLLWSRRILLFLNGIEFKPIS